MFYFHEIVISRNEKKPNDNETICYYDEQIFDSKKLLFYHNEILFSNKETLLYHNELSFYDKEELFYHNEILFYYDALRLYYNIALNYYNIEMLYCKTAVFCYSFLKSYNKIAVLHFKTGGFFKKEVLFKSKNDQNGFCILKCYIWRYLRVMPQFIYTLKIAFTSAPYTNSTPSPFSYT